MRSRNEFITGKAENSQQNVEPTHIDFTDKNNSRIRVEAVIDWLTEIVRSFPRDANETNSVTLNETTEGRAMNRNKEIKAAYQWQADLTPRSLRKLLN